MVSLLRRVKGAVRPANGNGSSHRGRKKLSRTQRRSTRVAASLPRQAEVLGLPAPGSREAARSLTWSSKHAKCIQNHPNAPSRSYETAPSGLISSAFLNALSRKAS